MSRCSGQRQSRYMAVEVAVHLRERESLAAKQAAERGLEPAELGSVAGQHAAQARRAGGIGVPGEDGQDFEGPGSVEDPGRMDRPGQVGEREDRRDVDERSRHGRDHRMPRTVVDLLLAEAARPDGVDPLDGSLCRGEHGDHRGGGGREPVQVRRSEAGQRGPLAAREGRPRVPRERARRCMPRAEDAPMHANQRTVRHAPADLVGRDAGGEQPFARSRRRGRAPRAGRSTASVLRSGAMWPIRQDGSAARPGARSRRSSAHVATMRACTRSRTRGRCRPASGRAHPCAGRARTAGRGARPAARQGRRSRRGARAHERRRPARPPPARHRRGADDRRAAGRGGATVLVEVRSITAGPCGAAG